MRKAALLCILTVLSIPAIAAPGGKAIEVGERIPEFSLQGIDGTPVSFERDIRGKAPLTLLLFMTTSCSPCFEELREIDGLVADNPGKLDVWCVAVDLRGAQAVEPFRQANGFRVRYLVDAKFSLPRAFGFSYTPSLAIVDARGLLLYKKGGYAPDERLSDLIRTFIK